MMSQKPLLARMAPVALIALTPLLASCGDAAKADSPTFESAASTSSTSPTAVEPTGVVVQVSALDNTFRPQAIEINVGDAVEWENVGANDHNVLFVEGEDWGVQVDDFAPGAVFSHVFTEPGEYSYYCSIHGNETVGMVGTVEVKA